MAHPSRVIRPRNLADALRMMLGLWGNLLLVACILLLSSARFAFPSQPAVRISTVASWQCVLEEGPAPLTISCDAQRRLYVQFDDSMQAAMIERVAARHGLCLTSRQLSAAADMPYVGLPMRQLPAYLNLTALQRRQVPLSGISATAANNELREYIQVAQELTQQEYRRRGRIALRLYGQLSGADVQSLIRLLQAQSINRYSLIVDLERR